MPKTTEAAKTSVLDALNAHGCITAYTFEGRDARPLWTEGGFDRAFEELKSAAKPFGLATKTERAYLHIVLAQKDKKAVDDWLRKAILSDDQLA